MTDKIWDAIEDVVVAARHAMDWLQDLAVLMAKKNTPIWWVNPIGFPVYQNNCTTVRKRVRSLLLGGVNLSLNNRTNKLSPQKQKQGVAPNFVHSLDSAHMMLTILKAKENGINNFSMIHDDFGTHACDVQKFRQIIRDEFVDMYKENEPLHDLYVSCALLLPDGDVPVVPEYGDLDLDLIRESRYFFA
jgi:DNA-directed RNA polymerase, mitochondrial